VCVQLIRQKDLPPWVFPEGRNPLLSPEEAAAIAAAKAEAKAAAGEKLVREAGATSALEGLKGVDEDKLAQLLAEALQKEAAAASKIAVVTSGDVVKQEVKAEGEVKEEEVKEEDGAVRALRPVKMEEEALLPSSSAAPASVTAGIKRHAEVEAEDDAAGDERKKRTLMQPASPQTSVDDLNTEVGRGTAHHSVVCCSKALQARDS